MFSVVPSFYQNRVRVLFYEVPFFYDVSFYDVYMLCYFFFVVFCIIFSYISLLYGSLFGFLLFHVRNYDMIHNIFIYLFNIKNKIYSRLKNSNSIPKPHFFSRSPLICVFTAAAAVFLLSSVTQAADVDLGRVTTERLGPLDSLRLYQEKYESLTAYYKDCTTEANRHLGYSPSIDRSSPFYHSAYSEVRAFYDNDVTKNTEIRIKEIRKFIMDSHRAGITNYYSYKRCPNGDPYLLITRSGDFSES